MQKIANVLYKSKQVALLELTVDYQGRSNTGRPLYYNRLYAGLYIRLQNFRDDRWFWYWIRGAGDFVRVKLAASKNLQMFLEDTNG